MSSKGTLNRVTVIGHLGRDPDIRSLQSGGSLVNFHVATTNEWIDKNEEKQTETEWHRIVFFGKRAEALHRYTGKGSKIYVEGRLKTRKWTDDRNSV